jgi:recombination protein RecA
MHTMANAQTKFPDKKVGLVDAEVESFDPERAQNVFGIDLTRVELVRPDSGEQAWDFVEAWLRSKEFSVIGVDSIASLVPMAESEADFDKQSIGLLARMTTRAMRQLGPLVVKSGTALILINQIRTQISMYGAPEGRSGGHALDHSCSLIVRFAKTDFIKQGSEVVGIEVKAAVTKNKVGPPKREAAFKIYFATGIDLDDELVSVGLDSGVIVKAGSWYKYQDNNIGQGEKAAAAWLKEHPEVKEEIGRAG